MPDGRVWTPFWAATTTMQTRSVPIDSGWEVAQRRPAAHDLLHGQGGEDLWLPAQVPGHVHRDLVRSGVIQDPFLRLGEIGCRWIDEADWTWRTTLDLTAGDLAARGN